MSRLTTAAVLEILRDAGDKGIPGPEIARLFDAPAGPQRINAQANTILENLAGRGLARRSGRKEPSDRYNNCPRWRWFSTPEGDAFLTQGLRAGLRAASRAENEQKSREKEATAARHMRLLGQLRELAAAGMTPRNTGTDKRDAEIRHLVSEGLRASDVARALGLTRERTRQIASGQKGKGTPEYYATPCFHGITTSAQKGPRSR